MKFILMIISCCIIGCADDNDMHVIEKKISEYNSVANFVNENFCSYDMVYNNLLEFIETKSKDSVRGYSNYILNEWRLDSFMLLSAQEHICIATAYCKMVMHQEDDVDFVNVFLGYKFDEEWYFDKWLGISYSRSGIQSQRYSPMTFDVLKYFSRTKQMRMAYSISEEGLLQSKEEFFQSRLTYNKPNTLFDKSSWEQFIIDDSNSNKKYSGKELQWKKQMQEEPRLKESDAPPRSKRAKASADRYQKIFEALNLEHNK